MEKNLIMKFLIKIYNYNIKKVSYIFSKKLNITVLTTGFMIFNQNPPVRILYEIE
jgi:hypothetical protein